MNKIFFLLFTLFLQTQHGLAQNKASLECHKNKQTFSTLSQDFKKHCFDAVLWGQVCFLGPRPLVLQLFKTMNQSYFLGDELKIDQEWYWGDDKIQYSILDMPNNYVISENVISRCSP